jgi:glutathionyl-hydroquinone reductase
MNMLVDGEWRTDAFQGTNEDGAFERQDTSFRDEIRDDLDARFQPEAGRYHLYVCRACPWAHRTLVARKLLGLEDVISVDYVDPYRGEDGWQFTPEKEGCTEDSLYGSDYLRELYVEADPDTTGRVTVPVLWDTEEETIVNNESKEILRMLATEFRDLGEHDVDLYPEGYQDEIDESIEAIYEPINNGVYKCGFADSQAAYDQAAEELFDALDHWDAVLGEQRYLAGDRPSRRRTSVCSRRSCASTKSITPTSCATTNSSGSTTTSGRTCAICTRRPEWLRRSTWTISQNTTTPRTRMLVPNGSSRWVPTPTSRPNTTAMSCLAGRRKRCWRRRSESDTGRFFVSKA